MYLQPFPWYFWYYAQTKNMQIVEIIIQIHDNYVLNIGITNIEAFYWRGDNDTLNTPNSSDYYLNINLTQSR